MSLIQVLKYPNKKLKEKSLVIKNIGQTIQDLVKNMFETMYLENGIGLAAPQVGELIRLIVLDVPLTDPKDPDKHLSDALALINPEVIDGNGTIQFEEGCLSCPELLVTVDRLENIRVKYLDLSGKACQLDVTGLKSVCIQHEIDHLNGVLLVDKVTRIERDLYKSKRIRLAKDEKDLKGAL